MKTMTGTRSVASVASYSDRLQHAASVRSTNDSAAGASACETVEALTKSPSATSSSCSSHSLAQSSYGCDLAFSVHTYTTYTDLGPPPVQPSLSATRTPSPVFSQGALISRAPSDGAAALAQMKKAMMDDPVFRTRYCETSALDIEC